MSVNRKELLKKSINPSRIIAVGFGLLILLGAILLMLPVATEDGHSEDFLTCIFTATSASCVTGLSLVDTATNWSSFGEGVILGMIQIGGIGFMTMAMMLSLLVKRVISPKERMITAQSFNLSSLSGIVSLTKKIIFGTFFFEFVGAVALAFRFVPMFGWEQGIWKSVFTSISAFCNAGFDLMGDHSGEFSGLTAFYSDGVVNITVMLLIIIGGIGFFVWNELWDLFKKGKRLSVYTKIVLISTAILLLGGTLVFGILEWNNPGTLGSMSTSDKILTSGFQSVTTRTAGFSTVDMTAMMPLTKFVFMGLMFIGGCSGSTAGGVKVGTIAIVFISAWFVLRGKSEVTVMRRRLSHRNILRAFAIVMLQLFVTLVGAVIILSSGGSLMDSMFEAFSASGTVGLTLNLTTSLNVVSKVADILLMYFGRVGILTVSCAVMAKLSESESEYTRAEANMLVG